MKRMYISPITEQLSLGVMQLLSNSKKTEEVEVSRYWYNDAASVEKEAGFTLFGIENSDATKTFTGGQGYDGAGNRSKGGLWDDEDDW